jgi:acyl-coenzyme A thioesterase PaaI-like protein
VTVLDVYRRLGAHSFGRRLFSLAVSWKAPYFRTVRPVFVDLRPGRGEVRARKRWAVQNHPGTFHAIACCNLAEVAAGTTMEVTVPPTHRWIPKGMQVAYLAKAETDLRAVATVPGLGGLGLEESREVVVPVDVLDERETVVHADIAMWVSPRPAREGTGAAAAPARA